MVNILSWCNKDTRCLKQPDLIRSCLSFTLYVWTLTVTVCNLWSLCPLNGKCLSYWNCSFLSTIIILIKLNLAQGLQHISSTASARTRCYTCVLWCLLPGKSVAYGSRGSVPSVSIGHDADRAQEDTHNPQHTPPDTGPMLGEEPKSSWGDRKTRSLRKADPQDTLALYDKWKAKREQKKAREESKKK